MAQEFLERAKMDPRLEKTLPGTWLYDGLIYIPQRLRNELTRETHEARAHGHPGIDRTLERLSRNYYFPGMRKAVTRTVERCEECARNKPSRHAPYGELKNPDTPGRAWDSVSMDFIVKLPESEEPMTKVVYDSILVMVDRLMKFAYFVPY